MKIIPKEETIAYLMMLPVGTVINTTNRLSSTELNWHKNVCLNEDTRESWIRQFKQHHETGKDVQLVLMDIGEDVP